MTFNNHRFDGNTVQKGVWTLFPRVIQDVLVYGAHFMCISQIEKHSTHITLVRNIVRIDLHGHGKSHLLGDEERLCGRTGNYCLGNGNTESRKNCFGFHCR